VAGALESAVIREVGGGAQEQGRGVDGDLGVRHLNLPDKQPSEHQWGPGKLTAWSIDRKDGQSMALTGAVAAAAMALGGGVTGALPCTIPAQDSIMGC
jgi:hypothetical protein